ncbi:MAG: hypothetical protein FH751_09775 [Firmicutes bacterium]|nr:hypothetical protein [Bacillota bacterium]
MGNKWELLNTEETLIKVCPCGKGGYYKVYKEYTDDYNRSHSKDEYHVQCNECYGKYRYYKQHWIPTEHYEVVKKREKIISDLENELYRELFNSHFDNILVNFKSKKALYEFCQINRIFNMPGTLNTFYKNGIADYFSVRYGIPRIADLIMLIERTSIELSNEEVKKLESIKKEKQEVSNYLTQNSVL